MNGYLLDTDTCIGRLRRQFDIDRRIARINRQNCYISEITVAELCFGAERSNQCEGQMRLIDAMHDVFTVLPITQAIRRFAADKARLWSIGQKIADFDLLIGATAMYYELILITNNTKHFERMQLLRLENWIQPSKTEP